MTRASDTAKLIGAGATINDGTTITVDDNSDNLTLTSTDADANSGPVQVLYRNSSSPADSDLIGEMHFRGRNDNSQDVEYVTISTRMEDVSDGTEDGKIILKTMVGGTARSRIEIDNTDMVINQDSVDSNFRVESDGNTAALFVDGGNNTVVCGANAPSGRFDANLEVTAHGGSHRGGVMLNNFQAGATDSVLEFNKSRNDTLNSHTIVLFLEI